MGHGSVSSAVCICIFFPAAAFAQAVKLAFSKNTKSSVVALGKGKALNKGKTRMPNMDMEAPDWGGDAEPEKEPAKKSPPREGQGSNMKGTPARKSPSKDLPARKSPPRPVQGQQETKKEQPLRKNPPETRKVKEENKDQPAASGSQWHPKDSWDSWEDTWEGWDKDGGSKWGWWVDKSWQQWEDDKSSSAKKRWGSPCNPGESQTSGSARERKRLQMLNEQYPDADTDAKKLAAMGASRFHRLEKRLLEREEKRAQDEKLKHLEKQMMQLEECNQQWAMYFQQQHQHQQQAQAAWNAAAWAQAQTVPQQGPTMFTFHVEFHFGSTMPV